ncbi:MAG: DUF423 domain-containing protein [Planctomycetes bacterium]|nr:DUF423 domain-containing protein [Planctomycetota bacterium]
MNSRSAAAISGFLAVALGAFGAHTLKDRFSPEQAEWWKTAAMYHLIHAAVMLASGDRDGRATVATWCFAAGTTVFSGSLYAMAIGAPRWFGAITPIGGLAFLAGWLLLLRRVR